MLARWWVLLPYTVSVQSNAQLSVDEFERDGYQIRIYPPHQAVVARSSLEPDSPIPIHQVTEELRPLEPPIASELVRINDISAVQANAIQIDFVKPDFERIVGSDDPPIDLMFNILNNFLRRLRNVTRAPQVVPIDRHRTASRLTFMNDDGTELPQMKGLMRARVIGAWRFEFVGIDETVWRGIKSLTPTYEPRRWDELVLDALRVLPDVGPALILASTALEVRIEDLLDKLALTAIRPGLWIWINDRGDFRKEPSVVERFDVLLKEMAGESLKYEPQLWELFQNLRSARNAFAHEGVAKLSGTVVDQAKAVQLIIGAVQILDWLDALLPLADQRPKFEIQMKAAFAKPFIAGPATVQFGSQGEASDEAESNGLVTREDC